VDYFSKHHPDSYHQTMQPTYLHASANYFASLQVDDLDPSFGEGVFIACNQAFPVAKAMAIVPVLDSSIEPPSIPTKPKNPTLWPMPSMSPKCQMAKHWQQKTTTAAA